MTKPLPSSKRGFTKLAWLASYHCFSFNNFYDPERVHFGPLRVLNDDRVMPATGFGSHPHEDMEIVTYVMEGALEHKDSTGGHGVINAGDVQRMRAGTGIVHSEYNNSATSPVHFLQVWFFPAENGLTPGYEQKSFTREQRKNRLLLVASDAETTDGVHIRTPAAMYIASLDAGTTITHAIAPGNGVYVYVIIGSVSVNGTTLNVGDAAELSGESNATITASGDAEVVMFDVALG